MCLRERWPWKVGWMEAGGGVHEGDGQKTGQWLSRNVTPALRQSHLIGMKSDNIIHQAGVKSQFEHTLDDCAMHLSERVREGGFGQCFICEKPSYPTVNAAIQNFNFFLQFLLQITDCESQACYDISYSMQNKYEPQKVTVRNVWLFLLLDKRICKQVKLECTFQNWLTRYLIFCYIIKRHS